MAPQNLERIFRGQLPTDGYIKFISKNAELPRETEVFDEGFIDDTKIVSYHCSKCNKDYSEAPKIEIYIPKFGLTIKGNALYKCNICNEIIGGNYLIKLDGIDTKFIKFDATGDYKKPTQESIELLLSKIEGEVKSGGGSLDNGNYRQNLSIAETWASKIGYDIDKKRIKKFHKEYKRFYMENNIETLVNMLYEQKSKFDITTYEELTQECFYSRFGMISEEFYELSKILSHKSVPDKLKNNGLKEKIMDIFTWYIDMYKTEIKNVKREKNKMDNKINKLKNHFNNANRFNKEIIKKLN